MDNASPYHTTITRSYYANLHMSYRNGNSSRGCNGPIFSREFCGGSNAAGLVFNQNVRCPDTFWCPHTSRRGHDTWPSLDLE